MTDDLRAAGAAQNQAAPVSVPTEAVKAAPAQQEPLHR